MRGRDSSDISYLWNGRNECTNEIGYNRIKNRNLSRFFVNFIFLNIARMETSQTLELERSIRIAIVPLGNTQDKVTAAVQHCLSLTEY